MRTTCSLPFKTVIYISKVNNGNLIYRSACQRQAGRSIPELNCWLERFSLIFIIYFRCSILLLVLLVHSSLEIIQQEFKFRFNFYLFFHIHPNGQIYLEQIHFDLVAPSSFSRNSPMQKLAAYMYKNPIGNAQFNALTAGSRHSGTPNGRVQPVTLTFLYDRLLLLGNWRRFRTDVVRCVC